MNQGSGLSPQGFRFEVPKVVTSRQGPQPYGRLRKMVPRKSSYMVVS